MYRKPILVDLQEVVANEAICITGGGAAEEMQ